MDDDTENVADVRRRLSQLRSECARQTRARPLDLARPLGDTGMGLGEWAFAFVSMHHRKRQLKTARPAQSLSAVFGAKT